MSQFVAPHSITALIAYALWAIALVVILAIVRSAMVLRGKAKANSFTAGAPHGGDAYWRLNRAHLNTLENLPIFAAIVLSGWVVGMESATFNRLAVIVIVARVVQSLIHLLSGSVTAVSFRFGAFAVQLVCEIWMAVLVLQGGGVL
ncbi:MAG TPA: MAPEG family protein [Rhizomicrobium sp.]|nr:MAPEG family protein [Rhizomicrobium sp.]